MCRSELHAREDFTSVCKCITVKPVYSHLYYLMKVTISLFSSFFPLLFIVVYSKTGENKCSMYIGGKKSN